MVKIPTQTRNTSRFYTFYDTTAHAFSVRGCP